MGSSKRIYYYSENVDVVGGRRRHKVLFAGHIMQDDSTNVRPLKWNRSKFFFFTRFEKCIQNKILLVQRTGKISWKELMENVWASRTTMNGKRKRRRKCFKMPIFTRGEWESSANMYSVRWDLSLRLSVSACLYIYICMCVWRKMCTTREGRCGRGGMKDARFTRFRFAVNSGVRTRTHIL